MQQSCCCVWLRWKFLCQRIDEMNLKRKTHTNIWNRWSQKDVDGQNMTIWPHSKAMNEDLQDKILDTRWSAKLSVKCAIFEGIHNDSIQKSAERAAGKLAPLAADPKYASAARRSTVMRLVGCCLLPDKKNRKIKTIKQLTTKHYFRQSTALFRTKKQ